MQGGDRFIGFDHEHLSRKQKVSMTAPTNFSVAIPLNKLVILQEEIHTQNAVQVYERKNAMSWRLIDETSLRIYMQQHLQTNYTQIICSSNESYRLHMSASFFMLHTHLQDTRLLLEFTWFYEYCVNLLNLPNRYTLSRPSTPMEGFEEVHKGTWI